MNVIFRHFLGCVMWTAGCCWWPVCKIASSGRAGRIKCPPIKNQILLIPAVELAELIRTGKLRSEEVVSAYIERCRDVQPMLNAVVDTRYDEALREAREADEIVATGKLSVQRMAEEMPLLGVPITVKESIRVQGLSNTSGLISRRDEVATEDADVVRQVRAAGGIVLLVSNTPELCMSWETYNKVSGLTRNPYDLRRTAAGSSGGEGALLGAAASLLSLSSDIGGSCRLPAMFNGVFGHKPTPRAVSTRGHMPNSTSKDWPDFFTIAPMCRYASDIPLLLRVMCDPAGPKLQLGLQVSVKNIKVYYMENDGNSGITAKVDPQIKQAMRKAVSYLESIQGVKPVKVNIKKLKNAFEIAATMLLRIEGVDSIYNPDTNPESTKRILPELFRYVTGRSDSILTPIMYGPLTKIAKAVPASRIKVLTQMNDALRFEFQNLLGTDGVFLYPTFPSLPHYHYEIFHKILNCSYMMIFNSLGFPVTNCTLGLSNEGLPIGMQVAANPGQDHLTIAMAQEMERAFGGWIPPPCASE
uniref:Putative amidase n=1 Tax=Xenopsylla cheopis TaxID=163159 RepID=A0A6M2DUW9_XENCH